MSSRASKAVSTPSDRKGSVSKRTSSSLSPLEAVDTKKTKPLSKERTGSSELRESEGSMESIASVESLVDRDFLRTVDAVEERLESRLKTMISAIVSSVTDKMQTQLVKLQTENKVLTDRVEHLENRVATLERQEDNASQYSRRNCLRVSGLREEDGEDTDAVLSKMFDDMDVNISLSEIDRAHRLGKKTTESTQGVRRPRDIIIKFATYRSRQKLFKQRKSLRDNSNLKHIFINEELTKTRSELFYQARMLAKSRRILKTWTYDGTIYVEDRQNKIHRCSALCDLNMFK